MKMNIHIWFNKCQLLIYMSVGKRRQCGANSAGHNWAPNSQLALSSRPLHSQTRAPNHKGGRGRPLGKGASALRPFPARRRPARGEGPAVPSRNPTAITGLPILQVDPRVTSAPPTLRLDGASVQRAQVCKQTSCHEISRNTGDESQRSVETLPSVLALHSDGWLPGAQPTWLEGLQPLPQGRHSASLPSLLLLPWMLPRCPP